MAERLKIATLDEGGIQGKYCGIDKMRKLYGDGQTLTNWMSYTCKLYTSTVGDTRKVNEWRAMYERSGYHIVHGLHNATNGSRRGAATLLMKMYTFNLTENDSEVQLSPGGEIAIAKKVLWKVMILILLNLESKHIRCTLQSTPTKGELSLNNKYIVTKK